MSFKFQRGVYLHDIVTGIKGIVVCRMDSLTGCNQYFLQPVVDDKGQHVDGHWYDEHSLEYDPARLDQKIDLDRATEQPPG